MSWIFLSWMISRSASIATRSRRDDWAADLGQVGGDADAAAERHVEEALHDQVGVAPDGRREMRVGLDRQAEVGARLGGIARLLHGAQDDRVDQALLRPARGLLSTAGSPWARLAVLEGSRIPKPSRKWARVVSESAGGASWMR